MIAMATFKGGPGPGTFTDPFTERDLSDIERKYHGTTGEQYMFVASVAGPDIPGGAGQTGVHRWSGLSFFTIQRYTTVFTAGHTSHLSVAPSGLSRDEKMRAVTAKTAVHEIGHVFDFGEEDDRGQEIYSGDNGTDRDYTPEFVNDTSQFGNPAVERWSVMSNGINPENFLPPTDERYTAFSVEEWTSMTQSRVDP